MESHVDAWPSRGTAPTVESIMMISAREWKIALTNYRRFVAEGGHDPIPQGSSYRPNGVTRADAIHVAAKTIWMMREGRRIDQVDASSMNCVDDVNYHGVYRPLFGSSFADPRMEVDAGLCWIAITVDR